MDGKPVVSGSTIGGQNTSQNSNANSLGSLQNGPSALQSQNPSSYSHYFDYYQQHAAAQQAQTTTSRPGLQPSSAGFSHSPYSSLQSSYVQPFQGTTPSTNPLTQPTSSDLNFSTIADGLSFSHVMGQSFYPSSGYGFSGGQPS